MPNFIKQLLLICVVLYLISCNSSGYEKEKFSFQNVHTDTVSTQDENKPLPANRSFIRTASLDFKTADVHATIVETENKTRRLGGYVSLSQMQNTVSESKKTAVSEDTLLQTLYYTTQANMTLRVPDSNLDSLISSLSALSTTMFIREIHCDDVSIRLLEEKLKSQRMMASAKRLERDISQRGKKLSDIGDMEETVDDKNQTKDQAWISGLKMKDAGSMSTVSVVISQDPTIQYNRQTRERTIVEFERPFFSQLAESFMTGWEGLKVLVLFLVRNWVALMIITTFVLVVFRYFPGRHQIKLIGKNSVR